MLTIKKNQEKLLKNILGVKKEVGIHEERLLKKAQKYARFFSYIPGILCICVGNSVAMNTAHTKSDIDLFIITRKKRIWTVRILLTLFLSLLGQRKTSQKHAGRFCLSFFITEDVMNLEKIAIKNDYYLAYWIKTLIPIVNKNGTFEKFEKINTGEITSPLSLRDISPSQEGKNIDSYSLPFNLKGRVGDGMEHILKKIFLPRTKKSFQKLGKPFGVIISDDMLKFHDKDKRKEIRGLFK